MGYIRNGPIRNMGPHRTKKLEAKASRNRGSRQIIQPQGVLRLGLLGMRDLCTYVSASAIAELVSWLEMANLGLCNATRA